MKNLLTIIKFIFLGFLGLFNQSLFGQTDVAVAEKEGQGLLWEISGNGLETSSFLFGTIHIISEEDFMMTETTKEKVVAAEQVVMELDMDDPKTMMGMMTKITMKDGQSLKDLLSEEDYGLVSNFFNDTLGMNLMLFEKMKPFMALSVMYPKMLGEKTASYEMEFMKIAKKSSLEILGLESVEDQMSIFDKIPYEDQAEMLVEFIKSYGTEKGKIEEMVQLYVDQDLKGLYEFSTQSSEMEGYQDVMLDNRNENWIPKMENMMSEKVSFFAVGAAHLWGPKGVINLLKEQGYTVKAVK
ncbi:MAG: TraB/GumN family protein [Bacteroidia bacterium]|nr:TraB/GumN family protein [Bacteroidia bacterium]